MKLATWGSAALAVCLAMGGVAPLRAQQSESIAASSITSEMDDSNYGSYESCSTCPSDGYGAGGLFGGLGDRNMQLVFGAEYIYAQATFSEALAYVEQDAIQGGETWHQIDFNYNSNYSFYGGV